MQGDGASMCTLDAIDFAILNELTADARKSLKELSALINLSAPAVATRIRRLESDETIVGYHAVLDYEKLGYEITAIIHTAVAPEKRGLFCDFIAGEPQVISCDHITGAYSVVMRAVFRNRKELCRFINRVEHYGKTQTQLVLSSLREPYACTSYEASV